MYIVFPSWYKWEDIFESAWSEHRVYSNDFIGCRSFVSPKSGKIVIKLMGDNDEM